MRTYGPQHDFSHEATAPTATSDRECAYNTRCCDYTLEYESTPATLTSDTICSGFTICTGGLPVTVRGTRFSDVVCGCGDSKYQVDPITPTSDAVCNPVTDCSALGKYLVVAATPTSNALCSDIPCASTIVDMTNGGSVVPDPDQGIYADANGMYYASQYNPVYGMWLWFMQNFNQGSIGFYFFSASGSTSTTITLTVWNLGVLPDEYTWSFPLTDMVGQKSVTIDLSPTVATRAEVSFPGLLFNDINPYNIYDPNYDRVTYFVQVETTNPVKMAFYTIGSAYNHGVNYNSAYPLWDWSTIYWAGDTFYTPIEFQTSQTAFVDIRNACPT